MPLNFLRFFFLDFDIMAWKQKTKDLILFRCLKKGNPSYNFDVKFQIQKQIWWDFPALCWR